MEYLKDPPSKAALQAIAKAVGGPPNELVRHTDRKFKDQGLELSSGASWAQVVDLLVEHPEVMQRPIAVKGDRAVIARPSERVLELL